MSLKKKLLVLLTCIICVTLYSEQYQIKEVFFLSTGITKSSALNRQISVDKQNIFKSKEELDLYISNLVIQMENLRLLESIKSEYTLLEETENVFPVSLTFIVSDSKHMLALPKIDFNSNTGTEVKIKMKDTNFLGLMNPFNIDINSGYTHKNEDDPYRFSLGLNCSYNYPFSIKRLNNTWTNDFSFNWTINESLPEFSYETGLILNIPFGLHALQLEISQSLIRNTDYEIYNDELYAVEKATLSLPLTIGLINRITKVVYTPSINFIYNLDKDGIDINNEDLASPYLGVNQNLSISKYNWKGNLRDGFNLSCSQSIGWNFLKEELIPSISFDIQFFNAFKYVGFNTRINAIFILNGNSKIGSQLRGIRDNQYYANTYDYALNIPASIVFNFDLPIHIITTHWIDWGYKMFGSYDSMSKPSKILFWFPHKIFQYSDFELQMSPFVDVALTKNRYKNTLLQLEDGFYSAGLEVLVYPVKWKSYVIRLSAGVDIGRKLFSNYIDTSWRDNISSYEITFGLGLHY